MKTDFDERELCEIAHAVFYAIALHHGTVGHNLLTLVAKLAETSTSEGVMMATRAGIAAAVAYAVQLQKESEQ